MYEMTIKTLESWITSEFWQFHWLKMCYWLKNDFIFTFYYSKCYISTNNSLIVGIKSSSWTKYSPSSQSPEPQYKLCYFEEGYGNTCCTFMYSMLNVVLYCLCLWFVQQPWCCKVWIVSLATGNPYKSPLWPCLVESVVVSQQKCGQARLQISSPSGELLLALAWREWVNVSFTARL